MDLKKLKEYEDLFQKLQMTYYALLAIPLFIFAVFFLRAESGREKLLGLQEEVAINIGIGYTIFSVIILLITHFYYVKRIRKARKLESVEDKISEYKKMNLVKYGVLCLLMMLYVLVFALSYENAIMGMFTAFLLYASFFRPELKTAAADLRLSKEEFKSINFRA